MDTHTSRNRRIAHAAGLLTGGLLLAVLTGCGADGSGSEDETSAAPTTASATPTDATTEESPVPDETTSFPPLDETSKPGGGSATTITGTIESGVESGCLVLEFEGTVYGIFGSFDSSVVYAGAQVTLHGVVDTGMMSTCQQGTPFVVSEAETAG
ncbi:hypothetical protein SAMN05216298_4340 [Glycomyces sambucus]|uniref:Uncharacterized protein n=1 Tax=Glycomyces sambucus TaxID=380244 RepID=A0A1G9L098_9ACTN|nr:hypothetical protein [Glycomyces sambucus]SDL55329.1 hypothetical protein SAMN05216298_4340 [Glycomyces sambucus]